MIFEVGGRADEALKARQVGMVPNSNTGVSPKGRRRGVSYARERYIRSRPCTVLLFRDSE